MTLLPGSIVAMTDQAVDRLLKLDNGDAALLYLYLLRHEDIDHLTWTQPRLDAALSALQSQGMAPSFAPRADAPAADRQPPEYTTEDINAVLGDSTGVFTHLCDEVERRLGKKLNAMELKGLFTLYDHLSLPAEVIMMLIGWCNEEIERKYGPGRRANMTMIKREGFVWARRGVDTLEKAEEQIQKLSRLRSRESEVLRLLDIPQRPLVEREKNYIAAWDEMGFDDETIRMAYERTIIKKQVMDWGYMNGILRRWHEKGLHTVAAVRSGDRDGGIRAGQPRYQPPAGGEQPRPQQDDAMQILRLMEEMKKEG